MSKESIPEYIERLSNDAMNLSLKYAERLMTETKEGDPEPAESDEDLLSRINEIKKHLSFAKKLNKELNPDTSKNKKQGSSFDENIVEKLKSIQSSVGDIVRSMPQS